MTKKKVAVFASGAGSNARKIFEHSLTSSDFEVCCILSNKANAGVIKWAEESGIPHLTFTRDQFYESSQILEYLAGFPVDLIVLAGFLWLIPPSLIDEYPKRILNIHPALLPKYGGKGMYGKYVHQAVKEHREAFSGPTIHFVNEQYDEGQIILHARCHLDPEDDASGIASKVLQLEHFFYPRVVEALSKSI